MNISAPERWTSRGGAESGTSNGGAASCGNGGPSLSSYDHLSVTKRTSKRPHNSHIKIHTSHPVIVRLMDGPALGR